VLELVLPPLFAAVFAAGFAFAVDLQIPRSLTP